MPTNYQPYIYAPPPPRYSNIDLNNGFDPKAVTRASLVQSAFPQSKLPLHGPLVDFNRHPDSYLILPYGQTNAKPMPATTKKAIAITRLIQFILRILQMIGALGMLVCVICIQNTQATEGYVIRVPAAVDILTTAYAIYHLSRAAKCRTAASSASYHFFALVIDVGLVPFYVFIAMLAKVQLAKKPKSSLRWDSYFDLSGTNKVILSTWLDSIVLGGLHLATCLISLYLVIVFRKISKLPPDLNPLEDNLTSRRKSKHKYKNSEISKSDISAPISASTESLSKSGRSSPLKQQATAEVQQVSFLHTRANSDYSYSPHNPNTANMMRSNLAVAQDQSLYSQPRSERLSRANLSNKMSDHDDEYPRTETLKSEQTMMTTSSRYSDDLERTGNLKDHTPPLPRKSSKRHSLLSDNWFVHHDDEDEANGDRNDGGNVSPGISIVDEDDNDIIVHRGEKPGSGFNFGPLMNQGRPYSPVRQDSSHDITPIAQRRERPVSPPKDDGYILAPLGMNPPTPPPGQHLRCSQTGRWSRPLDATSGNIQSLSQGNTPNKARYYGDLGSAVTGIRQSPRSNPRASPQPPGSSQSHKSYNSADGATIPHPRKNVAVVRPSNGNSKAQLGTQKGDTAHTRGERHRVDAYGRVISRSGADVSHEPLYSETEGNVYMKASANVRGRNVSGKVAEEGRGGYWGLDRA